MKKTKTVSLLSGLNQHTAIEFNIYEVGLMSLMRANRKQNITAYTMYMKIRACFILACFNSG